MILLHGGSGSWTHWIRNIDALAATRRVVAPDLPGCGSSPGVPPDISPDAYVEIVRSIVDELIPDGETAELAGFSFGGGLAAAIAALLQDRISRLSLLGPAGFGISRDRKLDLRKMIPWDSPEAELRSVVAHNLGQLMLHETPQPTDPAVDLQMENLRTTRLDSRRISWRTTLVGDLQTYRGKVQLIWGKQDRLAFPSPQDRGGQVQAIRPDARIRYLDGAGHWVQYEQADDVNACLYEFHD